MWKALTRGEPFELQWLSSWIEEMRRVGLKLADIQDSNLLVPPYTLYPFAHGSSDYSKKNINKWMVYDSYTHMTNNRLGILNRDEGYLAYLISESTLSLLGKH